MKNFFSTVLIIVSSIFISAQADDTRILFVIDATTAAAELSIEKSIDNIVQSPWNPLQGESRFRLQSADADAVILVSEAEKQQLELGYSSEQEIGSVSQLLHLASELLASTSDGVGFVVVHNKPINTDREYCALFEYNYQLFDKSEVVVIGYQTEEKFQEADLQCFAHNMKGFYYNIRNEESLENILLTSIESLTLTGMGEDFVETKL